MAAPAPLGLEAAQGVGQDIEKEIERHNGEKDEQQHMSEATTRRSSTFENIENEDSVHQLARVFTQHTIKNAEGESINPFHGSEDPLLDPSSGHFSTRAWMKNLMSITSRDPERYPERTAGVSYTKLSAHGFGTPTDYQKTFGNYPLEVVGLFKRLIGRRHQTKIQILRDFDGLVRAGEMLVVLGRPGRSASFPYSLEGTANIGPKRLFYSTEDNCWRDVRFFCGSRVVHQLPGNLEGADA